MPRKHVTVIETTIYDWGEFDDRPEIKNAGRFPDLEVAAEYSMGNHKRLAKDLYTYMLKQEGVEEAGWEAHESFSQVTYEIVGPRGHYYVVSRLWQRSLIESRFVPAFAAMSGGTCEIWRKNRQEQQ